jgi:hypothetical protein
LSQPVLPPGSPEKEKSAKKKKLSRKEKFAKSQNYTNLTQEQIDKEIEFDNDVELEKTLWRVLRDKKSVNNLLVRFSTKDSFHRLKVNDIIKFGRVNFKLSII